MIPEGIDGIDHINIYSKGKTKLGRWLTNFSYSPISIPDFGDFNSIEAFWYYLGCEDDSLRPLSGWQAKQKGRQIKQTIERNNFEELIKAAIDIKLKSNIPLLLEFKQSTLPLFHYYEYGDKRVDAGYEWILDHISDRRQLLKDKWNKGRHF